MTTNTLDTLASSKTSFHKGEWTHCGKATWSVNDPEFGTLYLQLAVRASTTVVNQRTQSSNTLKIEIGTSLDPEGLLERGHTVLSTTYLGERFEKWDVVKARVDSRLLSQFGITV